MERFFEEQNFKLYRNLCDPGIDATQRAIILKQLAEEDTKFKEHLRCTGIIEGQVRISGSPRSSRVPMAQPATGS
jgi:hypothetical protein